ncbi:MAG: TlpA family protein disulfide reductase, partial [Acidobacteria bacterium]|nr:TlpA family protein disulfide reductase [Acidobacteriota bacterium]
MTSKAAVAKTSVVGSWDAVVTVGKAEVPFRFDIAVDGSEARGFFFEGTKRIASTSGKFANGELELNYGFLSSTLTAKFDGQVLVGTYRYNRKNGKEYAFRATRASQVAIGSEKGPVVSGDWEMKLVGEDRSEKKDPRIALTWQLYLRDAANGVSGSILRVDGDTGNLTGGWYGDTLTLSHFAGERPVLLQAKLSGDGTLDILYNNENRYLAVRKTDASTRGIAAPVDPNAYTSVKNQAEPFHFSFPDLNGRVVSNEDPQFKNEVVILAIGGTWCPNCRDETPFLVDLYQRFHSRGLEIVGLNFEAAGDLAEDKPSIESFVKEFSVPYPILYAGAIPDVKDKLPQLVNFGAYPTTIFLGRDGRVSTVHAGFASL